MGKAIALILVALVIGIVGCNGGGRGLFGDPNYDAKIYPGQFPKEYEGWRISLDGGGWRGSSLTVEVTITNLGLRRTLDPHGFGYSMILVAIDSTNKIIGAEDTSFYGESAYHKEYYPKESWSGSLEFKMSPYSGKTKLYLTRFNYVRKYFLFDLGSPPKD